MKAKLMISIILSLLLIAPQYFFVFLISNSLNVGIKFVLRDLQEERRRLFIALQPLMTKNC